MNCINGMLDYNYDGYFKDSLKFSGFRMSFYDKIKIIGGSFIMARQKESTIIGIRYKGRGKTKCVH